MADALKPGTVYVGDCISVMRSWPDACVDCVVTSPPYWGLRDYGTASWTGGDPGCDHRHVRGGNGSSSAKQVTSAGTQTYAYSDSCRRCGAERDSCRRCGAERVDRQLGLEPTPDEYVARMVDVFREVRRVLTPEGTLWLNLGDSYSSHDPGGRRNGEFLNPGGRQSESAQGVRNRAGSYRPFGLKPKDLVGIPWRVAFALQADGWWLRSDIVWSKPNPMPESVTDRPTKAHEYVFLLTKSARYYYDAGAVAEPSVGRTWHDVTGPPRLNVPGQTKQDGHGRRHAGFNARYFAGEPPATRNLRSVWHIATQPYPEAHFATYPEALVVPCIKAGCPPDGVVLDPFAGSGTTLAVAQGQGRGFVGIELSPAYAELARNRVGGMFCELVEAPSWLTH